MDDVVMPWAFGGTRMALDHSLTHSLTHSILINLFIKVRLNTLLLPPLLSITFVPSAFYAYVWHILEGTSKAYIFSRHKRVASRRWVLYKWKYSKEHWQYHLQEMDWDLELLKGHWNNWAWIIAVYLDELCTFVPDIILDMEKMRSTGVWKSYNSLTMGFRSAKSE